MKDGLSSENVMTHWVQVRKTELVVDQGPLGIAATLYQKNPDTNCWHTINYCSRALTPKEQQNIAVDGESLAILYGITTNCMYLYWQSFEVIIDHQPLVTLYNNPRKQGRARVELTH